MTSRAAAARYARALFDVALVEADVEKVQSELQQFAEVVSSSTALTSVFGNPAIPAAKKRAVVEAILQRLGPLSRPLEKLLALLAERDRLMLLPDLSTAYRARVLEHQRVIRGDVTTAAPLASETLRHIEEGLARATGRRVILNTRVDPSIIGGAITRIGSTVYDGSVTTQLQKMKQALIAEGHSE